MDVQHFLPAFGRVPKDPINGPSSGIVKAALMFARHLARNQHHVSLTGWSEGQPRRHQTPEGVEINTHPGYRFGQFRQWDVRWMGPMAVHSYRRAKPDVLHVHADPRLLYLRGRWKVLHLHTPVPDAGNPAYRRLLKEADAVICCSDFIRNNFLTNSGWDEQRTFVVHNGADTERYQISDPAERYEARSRLNIDRHMFVVLYAGAIVPEKGLQHLLRAFLHFSAQRPQALLLVAGSSNLWGGIGVTNKQRTAYEESVRRESTFQTRFLGNLPQEEMPHLFKAADVVVVPSLWAEPFPLVALDSLAAGLPIIASKVGGLPEIVVEGQTGLLVDPGDESGLEEALMSLAGNPSLRAQLGSEAARRAQRLSWESVTLQLADLYYTLSKEVMHAP